MTPILRSGEVKGNSGYCHHKALLFPLRSILPIPHDHQQQLTCHHLSNCTGSVNATASFTTDDFRSVTLWLQGENLAANVTRVDHLQTLGAARGVMPAQLALAWLITQGEDIIPIPGTRRVENLAMNLAAAAIALSTAEVEEIGAIFPTASAVGDRYFQFLMDTTDR